jgi:hypothetical protein
MARRALHVTFTPKDEDQLPDVVVEGVALLVTLVQRGLLATIADKVRIRRQGGYCGIDIVIVLLLYFASGQKVGMRTLWRRVYPFQKRLAALAGRSSLPSASSVQRALDAVTDELLRPVAPWLLAEGAGIDVLLQNPCTLYPLPIDSPLLDAGDPSILDPDGSISDIGAYGGPNADPSVHADSDGDGATFLWDCDDSSVVNFPGNEELCDGVDNNCDGLSDDEDPGINPSVQPLWYPDCDGDGQGSSSVAAQRGCSEPAEPACGGTGVWVSDAALGALADSDCNDSDAQSYLGADELCAAGDQDCDGNDDAGAIDAQAYFTDTDGDSYGSALVHSCDLAPPTGTSLLDGDCDDLNDQVFPGAPETCNGADDDCNSQVDDGEPAEWYEDGDGDGHGNPNSTQSAPCSPGDDWVLSNDDCDDTDASTWDDCVPAGDDDDDDDDVDANGDDDDDDGQDGPKAKNGEAGCGCDAGRVAGSWLGMWVAVAFLQRRRQDGR